MPRCPVCSIPMTRTDVEEIHGHTCPSCFGHWLGPTALLRRVRADVEQARPSRNEPGGTAPESSPPPLPDSPTAPPDNAPPSLADLAAVVAEADSKKPLRCPECQKTMAKDRFQQMIPVIIDRCKPCDRVWLDTGEYNLIRRLYVEMSLSTDPQIVRLRDKIASANLAWESRTRLSDEILPTGAEDNVLGNIALHALFRLLTR